MSDICGKWDYVHILGRFSFSIVLYIGIFYNKRVFYFKISLKK